MLRNQADKPVCIGQKQKWFLLKLKADDGAVRLDTTGSPEFDHWQWVSYWYPVTQIIDFKRWVYRRMLKELSTTHSDKMRRLQKHRQ